MIDDFNITDEFPDLTPFDDDAFDLDDSNVNGMDDYMGIHFVGFRVDGSQVYVAFVIVVQPGSRLDVDGTQVNDYHEHELAISLSANPQAKLSHNEFYVETPHADFGGGWPLTFTASRQGKKGTWKYTKAHAL